MHARKINLRLSPSHPLTLSRRHLSRRGITLLEVIISVAIFLMSLVAIGHLISVGTDDALYVHRQARALQLCQSKMAELTSGVVALSSQQGYTAISSDKDEEWQWKWKVDDDDSGIQNLKVIQVWAKRDRDGK